MVPELDCLAQISIFAAFDTNVTANIASITGMHPICHIVEMDPHHKPTILWEVPTGATY